MRDRTAHPLDTLPPGAYGFPVDNDPLPPPRLAGATAVKRSKPRPDWMLRAIAKATAATWTLVRFLVCAGLIEAAFLTLGTFGWATRAPLIGAGLLLVAALVVFVWQQPRFRRHGA